MQLINENNRVIRNMYVFDDMNNLQNVEDVNKWLYFSVFFIKLIVVVEKI